MMTVLMKDYCKHSQKVLFFEKATYFKSSLLNPKQVITIFWCLFQGLMYINSPKHPLSFIFCTADYDQSFIKRFYWKRFPDFHESGKPAYRCSVYGYLHSSNCSTHLYPVTRQEKNVFLYQSYQKQY